MSGPEWNSSRFFEVVTEVNEEELVVIEVAGIELSPLYGAATLAVTVSSAGLGRLCQTFEGLEQKLASSIRLNEGRPAEKKLRNVGFMWRKTNTSRLILAEKRGIRDKRKSFSGSCVSP
jgi:hypothetical protein